MENYQNMLAKLSDLINNPTPRVPVGLVLDFSGSMQGEPITELISGVKKLIDEIRSDDMTLYSAEIGIVTFNNTAECIADFTTADRLNPEFPEANGITNTGEALRMTLDMLERRKQDYKKVGVDYYQPILVVMSDGKPNGDLLILKEQTERICELVETDRLTVIPVGIGTDADMESLKRISPKTAPVRLKHTQLLKFFGWLSSSISFVPAASSPKETQPLTTDDWQQHMAPWPNKRL